MSDNLPPKILTDILTRLPVDSLVQCTCVCKSWYSLLTNPTFITSNLNRNRTNNENNRILLVRHCTEKFEKEHYTLRLDNETFDQYAILDVPFTSTHSYFRIIGSSNGLVCVWDDELCYTHVMILWNPSIQNFVVIGCRMKSVSRLPTRHVAHYSIRSDSAFILQTNDYRVIRVMYLQGCFYDMVSPKVELYELSAGSWCRINAGDFQCVIEQRAPQAFLNGVVHWVGSNFHGVDGDFFNLVVSFDMDNEVFGAMMVPDSVADQRWPRSMRVFVFRESLSFIHHILSDNENTCCIWLMKDYGVAESWTKQFTIDLGGLWGTAFGFRENGDVLLVTGSQDLVSYDPKSKQINNLGIHGRVFYIDTYTESLLLLESVNRVLGRQQNFGDAVLDKEEDEA